MSYVISSKAMKMLDSRTIDEIGIPSRVLMETAGKACADHIFSRFPPAAIGTVAFFCGRGNNGGDGYVTARWLHNYGYKVRIYRIGSSEETEECAVNRVLCQKLNLDIYPILTAADFPDTIFNASQNKQDIIIDAIFGIGFHGEPDAFYRNLFRYVNALPAIKIAIDIPSGLDADTGNHSQCVQADITIVIEAFKSGHLLGKGREVCKEFLHVPIGIPSHYYQEINAPVLLDESSHILPVRSPYVNKGDCGRAFILAGSTGFAGAALLSAKAALRSGAGYVHLLHRPEMAAVYDAKIPEVLTLLVPCLPGSHLPDLEALAEQLSKAAAILIGPGFGLDTWALRILEHCLKEVDIPLIVDADGLALISKHPYLCKHLARKNVLLTPHQGEFQRLCGIDRYTFDQDPLAHLTAFVNKHSAKVLLKSYTTVYCDPHHTFYNTRGNDGLATGGSGDTLAGIICSFAAQGMPLPLAAINAAYLMGKTAEQLSRRRGTPSILPSDVIESLFVW